MKKYILIIITLIFIFLLSFILIPQDGADPWAGCVSQEDARTDLFFSDLPSITFGFAGKDEDAAQCADARLAAVRALIKLTQDSLADQRAEGHLYLYVLSEQGGSLSLRDIIKLKTGEPVAHLKSSDGKLLISCDLRGAHDPSAYTAKIRVLASDNTATGTSEVSAHTFTLNDASDIFSIPVSGHPDYHFFLTP